MPVASVNPMLIQPAASLSTPVAQFFIPATASLQERRPRTLKHGDSFAVFDHNRDAFSGPGSPEGIFHRDTRYLSDLHLTINGKRPILFLDEVGLRHLTVGNGSADVAVRRSGQQVLVELVQRRGDVRVLTIS